MQIYDFDAATGEYRGARQARRDPKESEAQGQDVWLIPANATPTAPPAAEAGKARVWAAGVWAQAEDKRGTRYWTAADGLATQTALGPLPEGATVVSGEDPALRLVGGVWTDAPMTDAERAALTTLRAPAFFDALEPVLEAKGYSPTAPLRAWLIAHISALTDLATLLGVTEPEAAASKRAAINKIDSASEFDRADPLINPFGALFSITSAEIDAMFLGAA